MISALLRRVVTRRLVGLGEGSSTSSLRVFSTTIPCRGGEYEYQDPKNSDDVVRITYVLKDGTRKEVKGKVGDNVMYLAHRYNIELEGACEASLACSTCHVYVADPFLDKLDEPKEEEEDMLDQAPALKPNSRLGCQIILRRDLDGIEVSKVFYKAILKGDSAPDDS